ITGTIEYRTDIYNPDTVEALLQRFQQVVTAMTTDPTMRVSSIDLLDDAEHARIESVGNLGILERTATTPRSVPELLAAQVARAPHAVAVTFRGRHVTYRELDEASNRLAHRLIELGAGPGGRVALLLNRSAEAVVAITAVLKTGAAYVPMDPAIPDERIGFILADAAPMAAVTSAEFAVRLAGFDISVVDVGDPRIAAQSSGAVVGPTAGDVAYLIYTSGTTGRPKGVAITHHNVTQLLESLDAGLPKTRTWTHCHSLAFDVSVWEIWGALLYGGRLVVVPDDVVGSPADFRALLIDEEVTVLTQTPSAVRALSVGGLESVTLIVVGEACPVEVVQQWAPGRVMINAYGPT
ncbi:AMP-binding protein, partial [Mycolicibacterium sp. BiH015]|uniref:AMP-binding protein n=1 Tax=Mycolicibacterium sp. BiH015 TaxID=3018808 RepID=UPI0022DEF366